SPMTAPRDERFGRKDPTSAARPVIARMMRQLPPFREKKEKTPIGGSVIWVETERYCTTVCTWRPMQKARLRFRSRAGAMGIESHARTVLLATPPLRHRTCHRLVLAVVEVVLGVLPLVRDV